MVNQSGLIEREAKVKIIFTLCACGYGCEYNNTGFITITERLCASSFYRHCENNLARRLQQWREQECICLLFACVDRVVWTIRVWDDDDYFVIDIEKCNFGLATEIQYFFPRIILLLARSLSPALCLFSPMPMHKSECVVNTITRDFSLHSDRCILLHIPLNCISHCIEFNSVIIEVAVVVRFFSEQFSLVYFPISKENNHNQKKYKMHTGFAVLRASKYKSKLIPMCHWK